MKVSKTRANSSATFARICDDANNKLFVQIRYRQHSAPVTSAPFSRAWAALWIYSLHEQNPNFKVSDRTSVIRQKLYHENAVHWQSLLILTFFLFVSLFLNSCYCITAVCLFLLNFNWMNEWMSVVSFICAVYGSMWTVWGFPALIFRTFITVRSVSRGPLISTQPFASRHESTNRVSSMVICWLKRFSDNCFVLFFCSMLA